MPTPSYETKTIEHLGLVAGMVDEVGISDMIDQLVRQDTEQHQVSVGQAVKAMILNGSRTPIGLFHQALHQSLTYLEYTSGIFCWRTCRPLRP